jgi:hypothetical protein
MSISKHDLVSCIESFVLEKQQSISESPNTIKKKELESHLEGYALEQGIPYEKQSKPTKTIYTFTVEGQVAQVEFNYRYSHYYTRHSITLK